MFKNKSSKNKYGWSKYRTLLITLSTVVVFVTTYMLILPAITIDKDTAAQMAGLDLGTVVTDQTYSGIDVPSNAVSDVSVSASDTVSTAASDDIASDSDKQFGSDASSADASEAAAESSDDSGTDAVSSDSNASSDSADGQARQIGDDQNNSGSDESKNPVEPFDAYEGDEDKTSDFSDEVSKDAAIETSGKDSKNFTKTKLTYEDDSIRVKATAVDATVPSDAELVVTEISSDMEAYNEYFKALNRGFQSDPYDGSNSLLYDVSIIVDGREYEPEKGHIDLKLQFKKNQLEDILDPSIDEEEAPLRVIHLPVTGGSNTSSLENVDASKIKLDYIEETVIESSSSKSAGSSGSISFSLDSLSVITVTGASTDVNITGALQGTTMKGLDYNVYAYLVQENGYDAYGVKVNFVDGRFSGTISNVPVGRYKIVLAYKSNNQALQEGKWNKNNVYECTVVENSGQYIFGYTSVMPADKTVSSSDNTVSFALQVSDVQTSISLDTIMDRAINYGIVADEIKYNIRSYTNFATKHIDISNSNDETIYSSRADGIDVVPNIIADIDHNGQPMSTEKSQPANYYVTDEDKDKVSSQNTEETIIRNKNELEDRVEIMISNTLKQAEELAKQSSVVLPSGLLSVDVSPYGENATIILDATAISGEQNGFTIIKRPGQTIVFNINGENAAPPQNIKIKLVDENGNQIGNTYVAGDQMRNAPASDGDVWNKIIWNFPDATSVTATNQIGGIFLVPKGDFNAANKGGGWIIARGKVSVTNEWYGFPGSDEPFKQKIIRKTFAGIDANNIDPDYALKLWTHTNESTSGTTQDQLISTLVLKPDTDTSLVKDPSGLSDQTGYMTTGTDADGNVFYEWKTPSISVGNEHKLTEINTEGKGNEHLDLIEFVAPFSGWNESVQDYTWWQKDETFTSESDFEGIFNVSSHNEDYRQYVYVTNNYNIEKDPHDLTLTKTVVDPEGLEAANQEYTFEFTLKDENGELITDQNINYSINGGEEQTKASSNGKLTLTLKSGETVKLIGLPYGTQYTIEETGLPNKCEVSFTGDTSESAKASGKLIKDRSVTATNIYSDDPGVPVTAHKDLIDGVLEEGQFTFNLVDNNGRLVKQATNDANGNISFDTLVFDKDGEYDYRLYEVADLNMRDIIFDPTVYTVHIVALDGRARQITYNGSDTIPMFRNRKITPDENLSARKVFIDADGKVVTLSGGEFTFTAVGSNGVTYTGTNDEDGMVTFTDGSGKEVDLNDLSETTEFTITEANNSYTGTVPEGQTLTYDDTVYKATATVTTSQSTVTPWTQIAVSEYLTELTVTFTPKETDGETYYCRTFNSRVMYSDIRSDGTVSFTFSIQSYMFGANQSKTETFEYGKGSDAYNGNTPLGQVTITANCGSDQWNNPKNVTVTSVMVDGKTLSSSAKEEKTVTLTYEDDKLPVFFNVLSEEEQETTEFTVQKRWMHTDGTWLGEDYDSDTETIYYMLLRKGDDNEYHQVKADGTPVTSINEVFELTKNSTADIDLEEQDEAGGQTTSAGEHTVHWAHTFANLPGNKNEYYAIECSSDGTKIMEDDALAGEIELASGQSIVPTTTAEYMGCWEYLSNRTDSGSVLALKNNLTSRRVKKIWDDAGNTVESHPEVTMTLYANAGGTKTQVGEVKTITDSTSTKDGNDPYVEWNNLPIFDASTGERIIYTASETYTGNGYTKTANYTVDDKNNATGDLKSYLDLYDDEDLKDVPQLVGNDLVFTNKLETVEIEVEKKWNPETPPENATVTLSLSGGDISGRTIALNGLSDYPANEPDHPGWGNDWERLESYDDNAHESRPWKALWKNLPKYDSNGDEIEYIITETVGYTGYVADYGTSGSASGSASDGRNVTVSSSANSVVLTYVQGSTDHMTGTVTNIKRLDINILKVDSTNNTKTLDGAAFTLRKLIENSTAAGTDSSFEQKTVTTSDGGKAELTGLVNGYYEIHETNAPAGYVLMNDAKIYLKVDNGEVSILKFKQGDAPSAWDEAVLTDDEWYAFDSETFTITAENTPGAALPSTGGSGTAAICLLGAFLIVLSTAVLLLRRLMSKKY